MALGLVLSGAVTHKHSNWDTGESKFLNDAPSEEGEEVVRHQALPVDKDEESWRSRFDLHEVFDLQKLASLLRHPLYLVELVDPLVEQPCGNSGVPSLVHAHNLVHDVVHSDSCLSGDVSQWDSLRLAKSLG